MSEEVVEIKDPKAVLEALERAKADAKKYREEAEALKGQVDTLTGRVSELEENDASKEWKDKYKALEVKQALSAKGVKDADRVLKFMDLSSVDYDDEGKLAGFDDAVNKVKADLPELFDPKKRVGGAADLFEKGEVKEKLSGTELQVRKLMHRN